MTNKYTKVCVDLEGKNILVPVYIINKIKADAIREAIKECSIDGESNGRNFFYCTNEDLEKYAGLIEKEGE